MKKKLISFAKNLSPKKKGNTIDGYTYIHQFDHAVCTEYYESGGSSKIGCIGTVLKEKNKV